MDYSQHLKNGIVVIGAGNVATHIALALKNAGYSIKKIYSQTEKSAESLAKKINTTYTTRLETLPDNADIYIISIKDTVIEDIARNLKIKNGIVVHTAGSVPMRVFETYFDNFGVFYPLQTFTKSRKLEFSEIPLCIEANNSHSENKLLNLGRSLSKKVELIHSEKRKFLHLAAVFACNFTNHMYNIGSELLSEKDIDFNLLHPLINETAKKANEMNPMDAQTGPAMRKDKKTIDMHVKMLKDYPEFEKIYRFVSESIYNLNKKD
ncbi:MAG TPA: DUF2520 domain-containing protein [Bacteroidales bacterium]|nr:DUF2520 domain-containing protein [Bacteroidales bacterium]